MACGTRAGMGEPSGGGEVGRDDGMVKVGEGGGWWWVGEGCGWVRCDEDGCSLSASQRVRPSSLSTVSSLLFGRKRGVNGVT
jgi:hypothetical protein